MKIAITEVTGVKEALLVLGLRALLSDAGIAADLSGGGQFEQPLAAPSVPALPAVPATRKPMRRAKAAPIKHKRAASKTAAPATDKPHITIRQRILNLLKSGPKTSEQVKLTLGLGEGVNITQHLYLIGRDKLAVRDDDTNAWSLV